MILIFEWPALIKSFSVLYRVILSMFILVIPFVSICFWIYCNYYSVFGTHFILGIAPFLVAWLFDSGSYFVGKLIGKRKLCVKISPGKTWEGFLGGLLVVWGSAFLF